MDTWGKKVWFKNLWKASRQLTHQEGIYGGPPRPVAKLWASGDAEVGQVTPALKGLRQLGRAMSPGGWASRILKCVMTQWSLELQLRNRNLTPNREQGRAATWEFPRSHRLHPLLQPFLLQFSIQGSWEVIRACAWAAGVTEPFPSLVALTGEKEEVWGAEPCTCTREGLICPSSSEPETASPALDYNPSRAKSTAQSSLRQAEGAI